MTGMELETRPVTPERWNDLATLAGERGFASGCWCMWWRLSSKDFGHCSGAEQRAALETLVADGREPGLLGYRDGVPVGWVALAPRDEHVRLNRSTKLYAVDDAPVWSVSCFYVHRAHRRAGVMEQLLDAAVEHASARGVECLEAYPIDTTARKHTSAELYTGTLALFERAGFTEVARRGGRPIVRRRLA